MYKKNGPAGSPLSDWRRRRGNEDAELLCAGFREKATNSQENENVPMQILRISMGENDSKRLEERIAMTPKEILSRRHELIVEWCEPWQGLSAYGKECYAHVTLRTSVDGCIALQRAAWKDIEDARAASEEAALEEFVVVHWAIVVNLCTNTPCSSK